jgi:deazaflavin-dependent oxidoreductase (nitroreductase family)
MGNLGFRVAGRIHNAIYRLTGGKVAGKFRNAPVLLLTTTGRKSGKSRTNPLLYTNAGDNAYMVIASKGGSDHHPLWYLNLEANPRADVTIGRETLPVRARTVEGEERERLWRALADLNPGYDGYAKKTTRRIPVVVLERQG